MPRTVEYAGRRFLVAPPVVEGRPWTWREHGESEQHEVETEAQAYLMIGGYCAAQRMKGAVSA